MNMTAPETTAPASASAAASPAATSRWQQWRTIEAAHAKPITSIKFSRDGQFLASAGADGRIKIWSTAMLIGGRDPTDGDGLKPVAALHGHDQGISDIAWSPDGAYLASASDDRTVRVWDVEQRKMALVLGVPTHSSSLLFSGLPMEPGATGTAGAGTGIGGIGGGGGGPGSGSGGGVVGLSGGGGHEDDGHGSFVFCVAFNPQGTLLASGSYDETVRLWDVRTGRCLCSLEAHQEPVTGVDFSHDGTLLVTSSFDGLARIWDVATMSCLREVLLVDDVSLSACSRSSPASGARFTPNSRFLVVAGLDGRLSLWDFGAPKAPQRLRSYTGHVNRKHCLAMGFLSDPEQQRGLLLNGSEDGRVVVWDLETEEKVDEWRTSTAEPAPGINNGKTTTAAGAPVLSLDVHPSHGFVATCQDRALHIWKRGERGDGTQTQNESPDQVMAP